MRTPSARVLGALPLLFACAGADAPTEYPDAIAADPGHYSVAFENDLLRILRIDYAPGDVSVMHHHPRACSIALSTATWEMTDPEGEVTEDSGSFGDVGCTEETVHLPANVGSEAAAVLLVELKDGATAGSDAMPDYPDAVTADPDHYSVEGETEAFRLVRVRYGPGETSVMHHHPANCVVYLHDQPTTFELPNGDVIDAPSSEVGFSTCGDADAHLPTNQGDGELGVVLIEMKGRAAAEG